MPANRSHPARRRALRRALRAGSLLAAWIGVCTLVSAALVEPARAETFRNVEYARPGGESLKADVYLPRGEGPFPTVLFVHGGAWTTGDKWNVLLHARQLADAGFAVVAINYRLAPKHRFPAQLEDCQAAVGWIVQNAARYQFDPQRILGFGYSAGAHLVSLLAVREPDAPQLPRLKAVVAGGAPCDLLRIPPQSRFLEYFLGATREENPRIYREATPNTFVTEDDPPFFFYHGEADLLVPLVSAESMRKRLSEAGVRAEMYVVPQQGHMGAFLDREPVRRAIHFFNEVLETRAEDQEKPPSADTSPVDAGR